jgi:heterodisulfide reductase subunit C
MSFAMDILPRQIMHLAQLGREEDIARSRTAQVCASCLACTARCPRGIDIGKIMEALRLLTMRKNIDYIKLSKIPRESLAELPQIALVSSFRKQTA